MTGTFNFELVGPESRIVDAPMWQVVIPGTEGEFGVRAGHCALVSSLGPGVVSFWRTEDDKSPGRMFVKGGFAHINEKSCTLLAEETIDLSELKEDDLKQQLKDLEDEKSIATDQDEHELLDEKLSLTRAKLEAVAYYSVN